ncbi:MAG: dephospho-CoA kinase, partial [Mycobacterium sp.]
SGSPESLVERARDIWDHRILPFAGNLGAHRIARPPARLMASDPTWPEQARRITARLATACGGKALRIDHVGSTAVPGREAEDVIDIQVTVESLAVAEELADVLLPAGYPRIEDITTDIAMPDARSTMQRYDHTGDSALWGKRIHGSADPGRPTYAHIRVDGWPNQQFALLFVDWLAANPAATEVGSRDAYRRAWEWADSTGWHP